MDFLSGNYDPNAPVVDNDDAIPKFDANDIMDNDDVDMSQMIQDMGDGPPVQRSSIRDGDVMGNPDALAAALAAQRAKLKPAATTVETRD